MRSIAAAAVSVVVATLSGCGGSGEAAQSASTTVTSTSTSNPENLDTTVIPTSSWTPENHSTADTTTVVPGEDPVKDIPYPLSGKGKDSIWPVGIEDVDGVLTTVLGYREKRNEDGTYNCKIDTYRFEDGSWVQVGDPMNDVGCKKSLHDPYTFVFQKRLHAVLGDGLVLVLTGKTWVPAPELAPVIGARAVEYGGKLYALGVKGSWGGEGLVQSFDGSAWLSEPSVPLLRVQASITVYDGKIYVLAGCTEPKICDSAANWGEEGDDVFVFDGTAWTVGPRLGGSRGDEDSYIGVDPAVAALNGKLYAVGGWNGYDDDSWLWGVQAFDGTTWATLGGLETLRPVANNAGLRYDTSLAVTAWKGLIVAMPSSWPADQTYGEVKSALVFDGKDWGCASCAQAVLV